MRTRVFPILDAAGEVERVVSVTEDITDRKLLAESHDRLVRGFTHDVKNPLGAADGYLALLEMGIGGEMSEQHTRNVERARRSIRTALDLINGLLEIERAEAGQIEIRRTHVNLRVVAVDLLEEFRASAESKGLALAIRVPDRDESLVVESDDALVRRILGNLLSNAVKYTPPHGGIVVEACEADTGDAPWRGRWAALAVSDNGSGIPVEKHELVFREFTRLDPAAATESGIGLAISRRLARALGGEITFASAEGVGSTFTLWLPLPSPPPTAERRRVARQHP